MPRVARQPFCKVEGCGKPHKAIGYCSAHHQRHQKGSDMTTPVKKKRRHSDPKPEPKAKTPKQEPPKVCSIDSCGRPHRSRGYCDTHVRRLRLGIDLHQPIRLMRSGDWGPWRRNSGGYVYRVKNTSNAQINQLQHRYVMEQHLGRELLPHENVHHLNGIRDDNRIENLELWSVSQPAGQRVEDKIAWAKSFLNLYGHCSCAVEWCNG